MALRATAVWLLALFALAGCGGGGGSKGSSGGSDVCSQFGTAPAPRTTKAPWPAPENPMALTCKAGLVPEKAEFLQYHVHAHLDVFVNARVLFVPAGIGIDIDNPAVQADRSPNGLVNGAGLKQVCDQPCISPLHTHDLSGLLHTETKTRSPNRLGQFFTEWAVRLTPNCIGGYCKPAVPIKIYVDGKLETGDPAQIELSDLREIAIVIGTPPATIPKEFPK
ncbi:MAG: hypothetical protein E6G31_08775 [Actinobacteria bacterium]|jgi:hypothetical protein|nr:MAG: hypothetical protein E6G31_08775 [Actinomycetota bacterium]